MAEAGVIQDGAATARVNERVAPSIRTIQVALLVSLAYYVGAKIGVGLTLQPHPISTLWPPNAILLAGLLLTPLRSWWIVLLAAFPAHLLVELESGIPLRMMLCWFLSNSSEALIGAGLIRWLSDSPLRFDTFRRFGIFVFGAALTSVHLLLSRCRVRQLNGWGVSGYWETWSMRFFSNLLATLTLVPVIVTCGSGGLASLRTASRWRLIEAAVLASSLLIVCLVVFTSLTAARTSRRLCCMRHCRSCSGRRSASDRGAPAPVSCSWPCWPFPARSPARARSPPPRRRRRRSRCSCS